MADRSSPLELLSAADYLARERDDPRHEYVAGRVHAMSPEGKRHSNERRDDHEDGRVRGPRDGQHGIR